ncbi:unnamed protein product, partial [Echinostoma caproni]|uniref:Non-specific protein-tyrosine kinase n=1 Tax=Echinostoma caproni TaxID=27848 RepID=A0A183B7I4_9TREM
MLHQVLELRHTHRRPTIAVFLYLKGPFDSVDREALMGSLLQKRIPRESAPECLRDRLFSQASDVWSWGVTCWEIWTWGAAPWSGLDAAKLLSVLDSGRRLAWPRLTCPRRLYQIMLACWRAEPGRRPSFTYLADRLDQIRPFEVVAMQTLDEADRLGLEAGDVIVVSDGRPQNFWWRGQNRRTGEVGSFPRGIVQRDSKLSCEFPHGGSLFTASNFLPVCITIPLGFAHPSTGYEFQR